MKSQRGSRRLDAPCSGWRSQRRSGAGRRSMAAVPIYRAHAAGAQRVQPRIGWKRTAEPRSLIGAYATLRTMEFKKMEANGPACTTSAIRPFGCMELWAGNERAHRSLELAGLEGDVIAVPSGAESGGDLAAVFSCSDNVARVVLADCVGHGYVASGVARHVHHLLHKFQDIRDTAGLLGALNDEFTLSNEKAEGPLRLTTVVTGTYDGTTGEFNFAYAAHPRM